jgi:hypothetical protein
MDKELQKKLIAEVMHQDEDLGLYDMDDKAGKLYLQKLRHEYEELIKETEKIKEEIKKAEEAGDKTFKRKTKWTKVQKKDGKLLS